jgi:hypothetical protein
MTRGTRKSIFAACHHQVDSIVLRCCDEYTRLRKFRLTKNSEISAIAFHANSSECPARIIQSAFVDFHDHHVVAILAQACGEGSSELTAAYDEYKTVTTHLSLFCQASPIATSTTSMILMPMNGNTMPPKP